MKTHLPKYWLFFISDERMAWFKIHDCQFIENWLTVIIEDPVYRSINYPVWEIVFPDTETELLYGLVFKK